MSPRSVELYFRVKHSRNLDTAFHDVSHSGTLKQRKFYAQDHRVMSYLEQRSLDMAWAYDY